MNGVVVVDCFDAFSCVFLHVFYSISNDQVIIFSPTSPIQMELRYVALLWILSTPHITLECMQ